MQSTMLSIDDLAPFFVFVWFLAVVVFVCLFFFHGETAFNHMNIKLAKGNPKLAKNLTSFMNTSHKSFS